MKRTLQKMSKMSVYVAVAVFESRTDPCLSLVPIAAVRNQPLMHLSLPAQLRHRSRARASASGCSQGLKGRASELTLKALRRAAHNTHVRAGKL